MKIWKTILAAILGSACGGAAAYYGIKWYDARKGDLPGRRAGWTPPADEEPVSSQEPVTDDSEASDEVVVVTEDDPIDAPYAIDDSEFFYGETEFEKNRDLIWYQESGVLVDDNDEIVPDPQKVLGKQAIENMKYRLDGDLVYVRNPSAKADYEVEVNAGEFEKK